MNRLKFDTRDKKPKLYHLLAESIAVAAVAVLWGRADPQGSTVWISIFMAAFYLAVVIQLLAAFFAQMQYNPYSYNTVFYVGFALFFLAVFALQVYLCMDMLRYPELRDTRQLLYVLLDSGMAFVIVLLPFWVLFSAGLCLSNILLLRREGRRLVNVLGIILSFLLLGGAAFLLAFNMYASGSEREVMIHDIIGNGLTALYLYFTCMLLGVIIAGAITARHEPEPDKDYLIVLGCGMRKDGTPTPLLRGRLDRALAFANRQQELTGKELVFVTSGGQGADEPVSESACMKRYLTEQGVDAARIIEEDRSTSTFENMRFSKAKILERSSDAKIAFCTTNYHVFRSGLFARRVKMRAVGMGARTKWYFWSNAAVREFVGLLTEHRVKQGLIIGGMLAGYLVLTLLMYKY